jgi:hypothetical protein
VIKCSKESTIMGLFGRKKKKSEKEKKERLILNSPLGTFYYINNPPTDEYGYEGYIIWTASGTSEEETSVYIDADSPDTTQAGLCYSRLEALVADQNRVEDENTDIIADHFTRMPDMVKTGYSRNTCSDDMTLIWLGVFRNGDTQFSYDSAGIYADDICLTIHADGSKEIEYISDYETHVDKLQT